MLANFQARMQPKLKEEGEWHGVMITISACSSGELHFKSRLRRNFLHGFFISWSHQSQTLEWIFSYFRFNGDQLVNEEVNMKNWIAFCKNQLNDAMCECHKSKFYSYIILIVYGNFKSCLSWGEYLIKVRFDSVIIKYFCHLTTCATVKK